MKSRLCKRLGIEFPLFAFSHCRDVVAEVSKAGGFGVLGAAGHTPESLEIELSWLDAHVNGASYGVDLIVPTSMDAKEGGLTAEEIEARIPPEHKAYVNSILAQHGIATNDLWERRVRDDFGDNMREAGAARVLDVAFSHPIKMVVNALGVPPRFMIERARREGRAGRCAHRCEGTRDQTRGSGRRRAGCRGRRSRRPLRRRRDAGAGARSARGDPAVRRHGRARGGRHRHRPADGRVHGDGRRRRVDRLRVADDSGGRNESGGEGKDARRQFAADRAFEEPHRQIHAPAALRVDRRVAGAGRAGAAADAPAEPR